MSRAPGGRPVLTFARPTLVERRSHRAGLPPGTVPAPAPDVEPARVTAIHYSAEGVEEIAGLDARAARALADRPGVTWVNVDGVSDTTAVQALAGAFGLHPLVTEDLVHTQQRPKLEVYGDQTFVVARAVRATETDPDVVYCDGDPGTSGHIIEQVSFVLGPGYVLSFQEMVGDGFDPVRQRIRAGAGRIRTAGPDYLLYALLDVVVDGLFETLERIGDATETLESRALDDPEPSVQRAINVLRREVVVLRRAVWPLREVLTALQRDAAPHIDPATIPYLRDAYDHLVSAVEVLESLREVLAALADLYLSALGTRQNEVMKALTVIGAVFLPLTFLTGLYGMNFDVMPELHTKDGYFVLLGVMATVTAGTLAYFRHRGWL